jgi:hypothetical protein
MCGHTRIKLLAGYWFAVDGEWLPPAQRFISGTGYIHMTLPSFAGIDITRLEFVPDEPPVVLIALTLRNSGARGHRRWLGLFWQQSCQGRHQRK